MREHVVPCDNLIPVQPFESFIAKLELIDGHHFIRTVVGDLVELKEYEKSGIVKE